MIKKIIKNIFNLVGYEVNRHDPLASNIAQVFQAITKVKTNILFDIGANTGQFVTEIRQKGYHGKIVSFEPLESARKKLIKLALKDENWSVHERAAIGDHNGSIDINISKNSVSSSILPMLNSHAEAESNSVYIFKLIYQDRYTRI